VNERLLRDSFAGLEGKQINRKETDSLESKREKEAFVNKHLKNVNEKGKAKQPINADAADSSRYANPILRRSGDHR
jgi:hypothetical protein